MAKFQKRKDNTKNNYFKQMIQRYGPDFLEAKKMERGGLMNEPPRVFRDLIKNKIDFVKEAIYFQDYDFLDALIQNAYKNLLYFDTLNKAMMMYSGTKNIFTDAEMETYIKVSNSYNLYSCLYNSLVTYRDTGNIDWIVRIPFTIPNKSQADLII